MAAAPSDPPPPRRPPRAWPEVSARCTGCGRCLPACAPAVLELAAQGWVKRAVLARPEGCTGCALCVPRCPFSAIRMRR